MGLKIENHQTQVPILVGANREICNYNTQKAFVYYNISIPANHSEDMRAVGSQMLTDATFRCPSRFMLQMMGKHSSHGGYLYHFEHAASLNEYALGSCPMCGPRCATRPSCPSCSASRCGR